jgi:cytochrome c oxidase assembly factor CtaG
VAGLTPSQDQQLGGAIMLAVGGLVYLLGALALTAGLLKTRALDGAGRA